jgi:hypothetical protein
MTSDHYLATTYPVEDRVIENLRAARTIIRYEPLGSGACDENRLQAKEELGCVRQAY